MAFGNNGQMQNAQGYGNQYG